jgi:capsid protein
MLNWLRNMFRKPSESQEWGSSDGRSVARPHVGPAQVRRWDGASTTDFNAEQWSNVTGNTINDDLVSYLPTLIDRCTYEISTNDTLAGMVSTHATDIVGPGGPTWQVYPRRPVVDEKDREELTAYISEAEDILTEWFEHCDYNGELSGAEILQLAVRQQWATGNAFQQIVTSRPDSQNPVSISLHSIHAERILKNPSFLPGKDGKGRYCLGIQRDEYGKRINYSAMGPNDLGSFTYLKDQQTIPASQIIHHMRTEEPGQIAGCPWLAAGLETIGDIRQFDKSTMKAAQLAASLAIVFEDAFETSPVVKGAGSSPIKWGLSQILNAPKGKKAHQIDPKHPSQNYREFRNERWRDVARSVNMPLMIARLDSKDHSYASARMDRQLYWRSLELEQFSIEKRLMPALTSVLREAELRRIIRRRPLPVKIGGMFVPPVHADPQKEANARATDLATMSKSLIDIWQEQGIRPAEAVDKLRRTMDSLDEVRPGLGEAYFQNMLKNADLASVTAKELISSLTEQAA